MFILHLRGSNSQLLSRYGQLLSRWGQFVQIKSTTLLIWTNCPHLLRSWPYPSFLFDFLLRKFAACRSHQAVIIIVKRVIYPTTQKRHQGVGWTKIMRSGSSQKRCLYTLGHGANNFNDSSFFTAVSWLNAFFDPFCSY